MSTIVQRIESRKATRRGRVGRHTNESGKEVGWAACDGHDGKRCDEPGQHLAVFDDGSQRLACEGYALRLIEEATRAGKAPEWIRIGERALFGP
jgi:hypothetical protein